MRRKISKVKKRDILKRGGVFTTEEWLYVYDYKGKKEKIGYSAHVFYCGWEIYAAGRDELEAYKEAISNMDWCEENPRTVENGTISINGHEVSVTGVMSL